MLREGLDSTPRRSGGHGGAEVGGCTVPAGGEASGREVLERELIVDLLTLTCQNLQE